MDRKARVFLSHSSRDQSTAHRLAKQLREAQVDVWIDAEQIQVGESIPGKISGGLKHADIILVLISQGFNESSWCRAEYEPLLVQEIEDERTRVIPILIEDVPVPPLLAAKRYFDLRAGADQDLRELVEAIEWGAQEREVLRLLPRASSREGSALGLIISSTLDEFPVRKLGDEQRLSGNSLVDLYRTVDNLVERFQAACDEVLPLLAIDRYEPGGEAAWPQLDSVNLRLVGIAADMREIAQHIEQILSRKSRLRERLIEISQLCFGISDLEFQWLELTLGCPSSLDRGSHPWVDDRWHGVLRAPVVRDNMSFFAPSPEERQALGAAREQLDVYLRELRAETAKVISAEEA